MMKRVRKPARESGKSVVPQHSQFASRPFVQKAGEHEAPVGEFPISFSLADIDIFPRETVQPKLRLGPVRYEQEAETVFSQGSFGYNALAAEQDQDKPLPNRTGMPDRLKAGIESLSGIDISDVRVHANSPKPARLNALAYTQGNHIHLGPGQERHLPHEAWHVVQQKEGRVAPTKQMKGVGVNDDGGLEAEATEMGTQAIQMLDANPVALKNPSGIKQDVVQASFEPARVTDPGNLRKINQWDTKIGAQIPAGTTILADTRKRNNIEEHRKFSPNRQWNPAVNVDPNTFAGGPIDANLKGYIRNKKVDFIRTTLKHIIEDRIRTILDNAESRHPNLIGHLNKPENIDFLLRKGVVYEQWNDNESLDTFCSGYELIDVKIDRIIKGADYVADSLDYWRTWLGTAPGYIVAVNIVEVTFMKSDLHERGLGVISVKFNKPVAGGNPMFGSGDIEVLLKPEDKSLEKNLLGWSTTGDQSAAEKINRILETQAGVAAGALPATEKISTIKMEVGDLPLIVAGAASRPTTLVEKVPGTQAQHLGVNPQTSRDEAANAAAHIGYPNLLITARGVLGKLTLEFEKVINALNTAAVQNADAPGEGFYPAITTAIESEITSAGANRVEAAQEASNNALDIAVAGIPDQLAALEMVKKAIKAIPRQVAPSFHETLLFAGIAGIDDLHRENVFWDNGIPYLIDADNVLNFNQMRKVDSGDIDQSGFGSFYNSKQAEINRDAIKNNNPALINAIPNSAGRRLFDEMRSPARATAILGIIKNQMQGKTARVVPIITKKWANVRNDYNSRDVAGKEKIINDNSNPNYLVRKGIGFNMAFGPGLFGTCNENAAGANYDQAQEKISLKHDLDISAIPFYTYEFDTGHVLHGNRDIYHGQTLKQALNFMFCKFHPAARLPFL